MQERSIKIPEGMLNVALQKAHETRSFGVVPIRDVLEAALRWLSENPIVPTDEQAADLYNANLDIDYSKKYDATHAVVVEWQRRMFLSPEPEIPEDVKDLGICSKLEQSSQHWDWSGREGDLEKVVEQIAIEAYRRGQRSR